MAELGATLHDRLASIVGDTHVLTAAAETEPYLIDWRGRFRGRARGVVRPGSTAEVAAVVRFCADVGIPMVPQGGNTGLCGGATPHVTGDEIVLALGRMNRLREIDAANASITVEAGMPLAAVQQHAAAAGLYFPLSLASEGSCTIGGNLSTNAGGTAVLRFGNARDLTLGLEIVLADGRVWNGLRGLRKDNTGYDLKHLFIGAEGTLGIVTAAVLKLFPAARTQVTALVALASVTAAVALLGRLQSVLSDRLSGFELVSGVALALSRKLEPAVPAPLPGHAWYVLAQFDDNAQDSPIAALVETTIATAVDAGVALDATIAQSAAQAARLWALRENISEAQRREGPNIKHDISLAVSSIPAFLDECNAALLAAFPRARLIIFGHLGDGNLHYNLSAPEGEASVDFLDNAAAVNRIVHDLVAHHGGSFSAEHGIGQLKRDDLVRYKSDVELDLMRAIKRTLDPRGLFNPGKVL
ncbi:MAG: FAD-binding oxidoreductase [Betaproteobacteria bacterium]|nr:FAD-binding oxidoreductase [Betaproteobacteria bacterium]